MPTHPRPIPVETFVLKVASRCNLNCTYCYVYNQGDDSWRGRPAVMSEEVLRAAVRRIQRHCELSEQPGVTISFHGGEPCLLGAARFDRYCEYIRSALERKVQVTFAIQTNGTLLDGAWAGALRRHSVNVGISLDGPPEVNDLYRIDHRGKGSYSAVRRGIEVLAEAGVPFTALCVIPLRADPLLVHRGLLGLNPQRINYLFPDLHSKTFETDAPAGTPCADFLIPIFDDWWLNGSLDVPVTIFVQIARLILGGKSDLDTMGGGPLSFLFIESDGEIEGLDVLKICHNGMARTGFNVITSDYLDVVGDNSIYRQSLLGEVPLPRKCRGCPEATTCSGGYLPHRYRPRTGFDNPSVWCADILKLFGHMRRCLNVAPEETLIRREALSLLREKTLPRGAYDDPDDPRHSSVGRGGQA